MEKLILIAILFSAPSAFASSYYTGNDFYSNCKNINKINKNVLENTISTGCSAYIAGYIQGLTVGTVLKEMPYCKEQLTPEQINDIFISWLKKHPERRSEDTAILMALALRETFPCN